MDGDVVDFYRTADGFLALKIQLDDGTETTVLITAGNFRAELQSDEERKEFDKWWGEVTYQ